MFEQLTSLYEAKKYRALKQAINELPVADIADYINDIENERSLVVFRLLDKDVAADVFASLDSETQTFIITAFSDRELKVIIEDLYVDDAVDMLEDLPANVVKRVLKNASPDTRDLINRFLNYAPGTVGSIMTAEFAELKENMTVSAAIERIRRTGIDLETIYICYVTDARRKLIGVVSFKDMLFASNDDTIGEIMYSDVKSVATSDDREQAAALLSKYDFLALPVVDAEGRLVGIVTIDDAIDVMEQEASEDFQKMYAMLPSESPYLKTPPVRLWRSRIVWLLLLMLSGILSGTVLTSFEEAIAVLPLLVAAMPMMTDTGGNAGCQSSTIVIRALAVGEIGSRDFFRVLGKETGAALLTGVCLAAVNFLRMVLMYQGMANLLGCAAVVSLCLIAVVLMSNLLGAALPMAAKVLRIDPAIMAGPLITSAIDILGLMLYFSIASALLIK